MDNYEEKRDMAIAKELYCLIVGGLCFVLIILVIIFCWYYFSNIFATCFRVNHVQ